jgi:hypothetical protein
MLIQKIDGIQPADDGFQVLEGKEQIVFQLSCPHWRACLVED